MYMENRKRTFELLEDVIGKYGDRVIIDVIAPKSMYVEGIYLAYWVLDNLEGVRHCVRYNDFGDTYIDFDLDNSFMVYIAVKDKVDTEPYYYVSLEAFGGIRPDDEEIVEIHRIHRRNGYDGRWVEGPIQSHYLYKKNK